MATFNQRNITEFRSRMTGGGARSTNNKKPAITGSLDRESKKESKIAT